MATIKNGTSRYDIKEYITQNIAPKYFNKLTNMNDVNVGIFGYITEVLADVTNDTMFSISSLYKEMFPQLAELPESIYNHALLFQLSNVFASPAKVGFQLIIPEEAMLNNGTASSGKNYQYFDVDSNMEFNIGEITFMLDYDIRIMSKKYSYTSDTTGSDVTQWIHSAQYLMNKTNDISDLTNPYIKSSIFVNSNGSRYIVLSVNLHQVSKKSITDVILDNDEINAVSLEYKFDNQLANFDVYYKAPNASSYVQLAKQLADSNKLAKPFCFYKLSDDNTIKIFFSSDDSYFQPEYNSEIIVELYTTEGSDGNFESYDGNSIEVVGKYDKYASNRGIVFMGAVTSGSSGGSNRKTIDELQNETIKSYSTIKSFTTTNDLNLYFNDIVYNNKYNSEILFMRKRDDAFERMYSAFILFKDTANNIVPTNTLDLLINSNDIDYTLTQTARNVIKAGKLFKFVHGSEESRPYAVTSDIKYSDDLDVYENTDEFVYINPFLTIVNTNPLGVSFYVNTINSSLTLIHGEDNSDTFYRFMASAISINRNAIEGEDEYEFTVKFSPTSVLPREAFALIKDDTLVEDTDRTFVNPTDGYEYRDNNNLKCIVEVLNGTSDRLFYINLELVQFDEEFYYFKGKIKTNDYISSNHKIQIISGFRDIEKFTEIENDPKLIPSTNCNLNVHILYKIPNDVAPKNNPFSKFDELKGFTLCDSYYLDSSNTANFAIPVQEIKSYVGYILREGNNKYGFRIQSIPLIKANYLKMEGTRNEFFKNFNAMYTYIEEALEHLTNNYSVDMKFFNTYGVSQHYYLVNSEQHIDKVNISIKFAIKFETKTDKDEEAKEVAEFIKQTIEDTKISLTSSPSFYISSLISKCTAKFSSIKFMDFQGINNYGPEIQSLESDVSETNIVQGILETSETIPEFLNVDFVIKDGVKSPQVYIDTL